MAAEAVFVSAKIRAICGLWNLVSTCRLSYLDSYIKYMIAYNDQKSLRLLWNTT